MVYEWLVYLHILSIILFMVAHGASIWVAFQLRAAKSKDAVVALLDVSKASLGSMYGAILALLVTGIVLGIIGDWWRAIWFWAALVLMVLIVAAMVPLGAQPFSRIRRYAGVAWSDRGKWFPAEPADDAKMNAEIAKLQPALLSALALGGIALVLWLMMFKPF